MEENHPALNPDYILEIAARQTITKYMLSQIWLNWAIQFEDPTEAMNSIRDQALQKFKYEASLVGGDAIEVGQIIHEKSIAFAESWFDRICSDVSAAQKQRSQ